MSKKEIRFWYDGPRVGWPLKVYVHVRRGKDRVTDEEIRHFEKHSPDGFNWGYRGQGPADLARCILIDYFVRMENRPTAQAVERAEDCYLAFRDEVIAKVPMWDDFLLQGEAVYEWIGARAASRTEGAEPCGNIIGGHG